MANIGVNSMPKTYKSWANGYKTLIETTFNQGLDYTDGVIYKSTTEEWEDRTVEIGGIGPFGVWDDGDRAPQGEIKEGFEKRLIQVPYGKEVPIGRLLKKFQGKDVNIVSRASKQLGLQAYLLEQKAVFSLYNYGFSDINAYLSGVTESTVSALLPDGKRYFSSTHPVSPWLSTTFSNVLTDNAVVGESALQAMITNLNNQLDGVGQRKFYGSQGYLWIVPLEQFFEAARVVGSPLRNGTADHDMNVFNGTAEAGKVTQKSIMGAFSGRPIEVRWVPFLGEYSTTQHFLISKDAIEMETPILKLTSQEFYTDDTVDDRTGTVYVRGAEVFSLGVASARGVVGALGTGTGTYTA